MKTSKKAPKRGAPSKIKKVLPLKERKDLTDPKESIRMIPEDEDDFEIQLDDDIKGFDDFDDDFDDDDF